MQTAISSVVKGIRGRGVRRGKKRYINKNISNIAFNISNNGVFPRNNLPRIKNADYVINLDDKSVMEHFGFIIYQQKYSCIL